jgi:hypothetical protein
MDHVLLCSHNPILIKNLFGILVNEGYGVEIADHPSVAVRMVLENAYPVIFIDSEPFGLPVDDAVQIIRSVRPETVIVLVNQKAGSGTLSVRGPVDLEDFKQLMHDIRRVKNSFHKSI